MILFLSKYPHTSDEYRDGFFQRVVNIDSFFENEERLYLKVCLFKAFKKNIIVEGNKEEVVCNLFIHFFYIFKLFCRSEIIYIQSVYNALSTLIFIIFFKKFYVVDLHGVVPEELDMQGKYILSKVFNFVEKMVFARAKIIISVTNRMVDHYKNKYKNVKAEFLVYAILPSQLNTLDQKKIDNLSDFVEVIYSGNAQIWQNVDLMLDIIKENISDKIRYTILTGQPEVFYEKILNKGINPKHIFLKSVSPEELESYYAKSHYGFILRDDILVNQVACPTKIVEYLNYGIIPIVLSEKIGDFDSLGYEFININNFPNNLSSKKSKKNIKIIKNIKVKNNFDIANFIIDKYNGV